MKIINKILKYKLCLGCGFCEGVATTDKCEMKLSDSGFYTPHFKQELTLQEQKTILKICPSVTLNANKGNSTVWGNMLELSEAWANDSIVRKKASSGGVISSLAIYLVDNKKVDAILHVGLKDNSYLFNELKISKTKEDILKNAASRYAPALVFNNLKKILDSTELFYAFIGKPCDIAAVNNFVKEFPIYKERIKYTIAIFCAGMPSYNGTKKVLSLTGHDEEPLTLQYRGNGWPGFFEAKFKNNPPFKLSYNESWGNVLGKHLGFRCKICPDGIGIMADISVGDSWNTKDGYPDFEETDGRSFVMLRTENGKDLFNSAVLNKDIVDKKINIDKIKEMQTYQYNRRLLVGFRILPVQILSGFMLSFKGLGIFNMMRKASFKSGIKNMIGTFLRFIKQKK